MGLFAFRRLRNAEALAKAGASFVNAELTPKLAIAEPVAASADTDNGNHNRRNGGRRKRQQLPDAGSSGTGD